eukprot:gene12280-20450_t
MFNACSQSESASRAGKTKVYRAFIFLLLDDGDLVHYGREDINHGPNLKLIGSGDVIYWRKERSTPRYGKHTILQLHV